jgi:N-acetylglucosamine kinase-like BadF-type ATPase
VLGIDGGASKTFALVADQQGRLLGFGKGGPANHQSVGLKAALQAIEGAAREALSAAHVSPHDVEIVSFGLAGADLPEDFAMLRPVLEGFKLGARVDLRNDTQVALRAGTHQPWGVVLICGTGFNAAGRAPDGREFIYPGLGWVSGDWGGGGALAQEMVRLVMRADDGRSPPTRVTELLLDALRQPSAYELMRALYHNQIERHSLLAQVPLLFRAAAEGDHPAQELIIRLGEELGVSAAAVIRRLGLERLPVEVVLGGSVFKGEGPILADTILAVVHRTAPEAMLVHPPFEPVVGSVLLGLEAAGITAGDPLYAVLHETMPAPLRRSPRR